MQRRFKELLEGFDKFLHEKDLRHRDAAAQPRGGEFTHAAHQ
jgi:hypothetical protein